MLFISKTGASLQNGSAVRSSASNSLPTGVEHIALENSKLRQTKLNDKLIVHDLKVGVHRALVRGHSQQSTATGETRGVSRYIAFKGRFPN